MKDWPDVGSGCFWAGVAWLLYVYAGYPCILRLLVLLARVRHTTRDDYLPTVSVLIAARNEERDIGWKLRETLDWDYPADRLQILVASDASEDRTDAVASSILDPRLVLIRMEKRGGKVRALNRLVPASSGEILCFTDANAHIDRANLRRMVRHFADLRVGSVTGRTRCIEGDASLAVGSGASIYWDYESRINQLESDLGSVLVCDGALHCARRTLYDPLMPDLASDLELPIRIRSRGYRNVFEPEATVLENDTPSPHEEFTRRRRICGQGALAMWRLRGTLHGFTAWQFLTRKVLRWLTLIPMLLVLVGTVLGMRQPFFRTLAAFQLLIYGVAVVTLLRTLSGRRTGRFFSVPFYAVLGALGAFAGVLDTCLGRRYDVWEVPQSSRGQTETHHVEASKAPSL